MNTKLKVFLSIVVILLIGAGVNVYMSKMYYPELLVPNLSKAKADQILFTSNGKIMQLSEDDEFIWYGFKGNQLDGGNALKAELAKKGWTFINQDGAGYFFEDQMKHRKIATSQMWTGKYVLYKVEK